MSAEDRKDALVIRKRYRRQVELELDASKDWTSIRGETGDSPNPEVWRKEHK